MKWLLCAHKSISGVLKSDTAYKAVIHRPSCISSVHRLEAIQPATDLTEPVLKATGAQRRRRSLC